MKTLVIQSNWLIRRGYDAMAVAPFILVRPKEAGNKGLLAHEGLHVERQRALGRFGTVRWWWRYWTDSSFRLAEEVLAYRVSVQYGMKPDVAAGLLASYDTGISVAQAKFLLLTNAAG